jgi:nitrous oxide reductase accessory protein NosL
MMKRIRKFSGILMIALLIAGCTVKAVGDPDRPITINANVVIDIRGMKETATGIEDMVAQGGTRK